MKKRLEEELEHLTQIIRASPNGILVDELLQIFPHKISKRTLQYRLAHLIRNKIIENRGSGKSSRYYIFEELSSISTRVPLSQEALSVQKLVLQPIQFRKHVSYQNNFLESYEPNKTAYLSSEITEKLFELGASSGKERPAGTYAKTIYQRLLVDLSWNSSRLEGNTYSLLETEKLLATGEAIPGKNSVDTQMILNHKEAIEFIVEMSEEISINRYTILNIHALLSNNLLADPRACGMLRTIPVKIGKSVYHPLEVPQLIEQYFNIIIQKATRIQNPFEQSFFLMVHLPYLQPFVDVNKRVSRLAGNIPLIRENLSPLSFIDVPESEYIEGLLGIYEFHRIELFRDLFIWAYERSASLYSATRQALGEPDTFKIQYRESIRELIYAIIKQKMNKIQSINEIQKFTIKNIPEEDRVRFIEVVEVEIYSLHEGNFARFGIRTPEFFDWQKTWY